MVETLAKWEFEENVKITLKTGEIVYCDIEEWVDDEPEFVSIVANSKTTNEWLLDRLNIGSTLNINEIDKLEKALK